MTIFFECAEVMKNINTVAMDELSPQQIEAARKRRMRERYVCVLQLVSTWEAGKLRIS